MSAEGRPATPLPPRQIATTKFPRIGERDPEPFDAATWRLDVAGLVAKPLSLSFDAFAALPHTERTGTIHCVTRWSRPDTTFRGVALATLLERAGVLPDARFVRFVSGRGHDTSLPLDVARDDVLVADGLSLGVAAGDADGAAAPPIGPVPPENGGPVRTVVFARYFYKSVKWVRRIELLAEDAPGFWERTAGYHNEADPWTEQRYAAPHADGPALKAALAARDLSGMDLRGADLQGMDLSGVKFAGASLRNANLVRAGIRDADLTGANLTNADLTGADLRRSKIDGVDLDGADLRRCDLRRTEGVPKSLAVTQFFSNDTDGAVVVGLHWPDVRLDGVLPEQEAWLRRHGVVVG